MDLERRRRSTLDKFDNALLIAAAVVGVFVLFAVVGWVIHAVLFLIKVAVVAVVFGLIVRAVVGRRS
jgi:hypothetical protein